MNFPESGNKVYQDREYLKTSVDNFNNFYVNLSKMLI